MDVQPLIDDLELHEAFGKILSIETFSDYISHITELIYNNNLNSKRLNLILKEHDIKIIQDIKDELLDLVIVYVNLVLNDHIVTTKEKHNVEILKAHFKIKEGDFFNKRYDEVGNILIRQFERMYLDNLVDHEEELHMVDLQEIFDLSYDQFDNFKEKEVRNALHKGAEITDLDTAKYPKLPSSKRNIAKRYITQEVKDLIWRRDKGQCQECGDNENLEFDHIIPYSLGGSSTYRNLRLLCQACNRKKSDSIG